VDAPFHRTFGDVRATFVGLDGLVARLVHRGR
jgi:hypothetical protein